MQAPTERAETRILLAGLFTETNTFVEEPTRLDAFSIRRGQELLDVRGDYSPTDGFLENAELLDWTVIPAIDYRAAPSGTVEDCVFEQYWTELRPIIVDALEAGLDGIFLVLHGAMVTRSHQDAEGELLVRIRGVPGVENLPIVVVLDLHANVTQEMARNASALIPYRENPHTDVRETAVRAAKLLHRALKEKCVLHNYLRHSGILLAPPATSTAEDPIRSLEVLARELEVLDRNWEVGIAPGFAHADMPDAGMTIWVVGPDNEDIYRSALLNWWKRRIH